MEAEARVKLLKLNEYIDRVNKDIERTKQTYRLMFDNPEISGEDKAKLIEIRGEIITQNRNTLRLLRNIIGKM